MKYKFAVMGLGKVGSAILEILKESGHIPAWALTSKGPFKDIKTFSSIPSGPESADIIFITVPDAKIADLASAVATEWKDRCKNRVFFHMSGQLTSDALFPISSHGGEVASLHPLQSIMDTDVAKTSLKSSYFTVEGSPRAISVARNMVGSFGACLSEISKNDKTLYHLAAVMASNYMVTLADQATQILNKIGLDLKVLLPLMKGTLSNIEKHGSNALTGPIQRGDWDTVRAHMHVLEDTFPDIMEVYRGLGMLTAKMAGRSWPNDLYGHSKIMKREDLVERLDVLKTKGMKIVFTNGCFDIIHPGHISYLKHARTLGDCLVVGLNSDNSVQRLKGPGRPINDQSVRAVVLSGLCHVDYVTVFEEDTPYNLIGLVRPDFLVKGGDWVSDEIVGADIVRSYGGKVLSLPFKKGFSTTNIIDKIKET